MADHPPLDPQVLVREADAIARLARHLIADPDRAADASQEAMRVALERGPRPGFDPSAWLRGVLRNVVRRLRRSDLRRLAREHAAAVRDVAPSALSAERLVRRRMVIDAVLVLPEGLRTTVDLRFFEGLPPRAIARRLRIPVETVRSRLRRALQLLREELDRREGGDGRRWALALAPIALPGRGGSSVSPDRTPVHPDPGIGVVGGLLMGTQAKVTFIVGLVLLLGAALWRVTVGLSTGEQEPHGAPTLVPPRSSAPTLAAAPSKPTGPSAEDAGAPPLRLRVTGLVTDPEGVPLPGAAIHAATADSLDDRLRAPDATTDAAGRFALERDGPGLSWRISASMPGRRTVCATAAAGAPRDLILRLGRAVPLWIAVTDGEAGSAIEGADVVLATADEGGSATTRATTDADGLAMLEEPGVRPMAFESLAVVRISAPAHATATLSLDSRIVAGTTTREHPHRVALAGARPLRVQVLDAGANRVEGAVVRGWSGREVWGHVSGGATLREVVAGQTTLGSATTDAQGQAELGAPVERWYVYAAYGADAGLASGNGVPGRVVPITLAPGVAVDGVVVDEAGGPIAGAPVAVGWFSWFLVDPVRDRIPTVPAEMEAAFTVKTQPDGGFSIPGVPRRPDGRPFGLEVRLDGRDGFAQVDVAPEVPRATVRIVVKARPRNGPAFSVRSESGTPIVGALVGVPSIYPAAWTDASGLARLEIGSGTVAARGVRITAAGFASVWIPGADIRSEAPTVVVLGPEGVLDLAVLGPDRRPVVGAQVAVVLDGTEVEVASALEDRGSPRRLAERFSDADGRVSVDGLPRGPIRIAAEFFEPERAPLPSIARNRAVLVLATPGPAEIVLPYAPFDPRTGQVVEGVVVGEDGAPARGLFWVALQSEELARNLSIEAPGGRFRFDGVPAGRWQLQAYESNTPIPILADVEVREGVDVRGLRVARTLPGRITGRVVAEGGADVSGLPIQAIDTRGLRLVRSHATTGTGGAFALDPLPAGRYRVVLQAPTGPRVPLRALGEEAVEVGAGTEARVELRAVPAARLVLLCDDERVGVRLDGPPTIQVLQSTEAQTNLTLDGPTATPQMAFGLYRGRNEQPWALGPGHYRVRVSRGDHLSASVEFDVRGAGDVEVPVTFPVSQR